MTVRFLSKMLTAETKVIVKDQKTGKTYYKGCASEANFEDNVKDWDFSNNHIIYI